MVDIDEKDINKLIDIPLHELTEEQVEIVINWKANEQFKKQMREEEFKLLKAELENEAEIAREAAQAAINTLDELKEAALAFYNAQ